MSIEKENNYMNDHEYSPEIDSDIEAFFDEKWIEVYSYDIKRHFYSDWKHKIIIDIEWLNKEENFELRAWDNKYDLYEILEDIISSIK